MSVPSGKEMIENASSRDTLAKQLFVVFTEPIDGLENDPNSKAEHLKYQVEIEQKGIMLAAGRLADDSGESWSGDGMVIIRADSLEKATKIAEADPMHSSSARKLNIRPWVMNEGGFKLRATFSEGKQRID